MNGQQESGKKYDVFLSYAHVDAPAVEALAVRLEDEAGLTVWLDRWVLVPGKNVQQATAKGLDEAGACAVFLGSKAQVGWFGKEIESALERQAEDGEFRVIPVLLPGTERSLAGGFLGLNTWVEFKGGLDDPDAFHRLVSGIKGVAPGRGVGRPAMGTPRASAPAASDKLALEDKKEEEQRTAASEQKADRDERAARSGPTARPAAAGAAVPTRDQAAEVTPASAPTKGNPPVTKQPPAFVEAPAQRHFKPSRKAIRIGVAVLLLVAAAGIYLLVNSTLVGKSPFEVKAEYVSAEPQKWANVVVFVHGILGSRTDTWTNQNASFPKLLATDPEFTNNTDVFVYEYYTPKFGNAASIVQLADQLRGSLEDHRIFDDHERVVFLSHSMGGLIVRQFLLSNRERIQKVPMLFFYATPTNGSDLTRAAKELSGNPQLRGMLPLEGNDLLQSITSQWLHWEEAKKIPSYCAYETLPTFGVWVVPESSATALCNQSPDPLTGDHIDVVKPADRSDPRYTRFATALRKVVSS
jgi:hypothetical protein